VRVFYTGRASTPYPGPWGRYLARATATAAMQRHAAPPGYRPNNHSPPCAKRQILRVTTKSGLSDVGNAMSPSRTWVASRGVLPFINIGATKPCYKPDSTLPNRYEMNVIGRAWEQGGRGAIFLPRQLCDTTRQRRIRTAPWADVLSCVCVCEVWVCRGSAWRGLPPTRKDPPNGTARVAIRQAVRHAAQQIHTGRGAP
jgi:hypothetical protein